VRFVRNDPTLGPGVTSRVEAWIKQDGDLLKVAADVANGSKHMVLAAWSIRAGGSEQTRNDVTVTPATVQVSAAVARSTGRSALSRHTFYITDKRTGDDHEAVALADGCIKEWQAFLSSNQLGPPAGGS